MIYDNIPEKYLCHEDVNKAINELCMLKSILNKCSEFSLGILDKEERSENARRIGILINAFQNFKNEINKMLEAYQIVAQRYAYVITWWDGGTTNAVYEALVHRVSAWLPFDANYKVIDGVKPFQKDVVKPFFELMEKYDKDKMFSISAEMKDFSLNNGV